MGNVGLDVVVTVRWGHFNVVDECCHSKDSGVSQQVDGPNSSIIRDVGTIRQRDFVSELEQRTVKVNVVVGGCLEIKDDRLVRDRRVVCWCQNLIAIALHWQL